MNPLKHEIIISENQLDGNPHKPLIQKLMGAIRGTVHWVVNAGGSVDQQESLENTSRLFELNGVVNVQTAIQILSEMPDEEILGNQSIKDLLKYFHEDIPNKNGLSFTKEIRGIITVRIIEIKDKETGNLDGKKSEYNKKKSEEKAQYSHENNDISQIITQALLSMSGESDILKLLEMFDNHMEKLTFLDSFGNKDKKYVCSMLRECIENILEGEQEGAFSRVYARKLNEEAVLDKLQILEKKYHLRLGNIKINILNYIAFTLFTKHVKYKYISAKITKLGNKYGIGRVDIRSIKQPYGKTNKIYFKGGIRHTGPRSYLNYVDHPRTAKKEK